MKPLAAKGWAIVATVAAVCCLHGAPGPWESLAPLPEANAGFAIGRVQRSIVVMGGTNWANGGKNWLRSVHAFDLEALQWTTLAPLAQPLAYAVAVSHDGGLLAVGGTTGEVPFRGSVLVRPDLAVAERERGVTTPVVLSAGGLAAGRVVLVGGTDSAANVAGFRCEALAWEPATAAEHPLPPIPGPPFGIGTAVGVGDELLVFGGCRPVPRPEQVANLADAWAFSVRQNEWRALSPMPHAARGVAAVALGDRFVYLAGGCRDEPVGFTDEACIYDRAANHYFPAPSLPYRAALVGLVADEAYVYCIAGEPGSQQRTAAVYRIKRSALLVEVGLDR